MQLAGPVQPAEPVTATQAATTTTQPTTIRPPTTTATATTGTIAQEVIGTVVSVTDGDTNRVRMPDGETEPVRLIGIDSPKDGSLLANQATLYLEGLVLGEEVRLVVDGSDRDRFDRLLRYVYLEDLFVNEEMVLAGLEVAKRYEPDTAMATVLEAAQAEAEQSQLGLFSAVAITTSQATTTTQAATTTTRPATTTIATTTTQANCHPSYPDFCIRPPPPDLDCGDVGTTTSRCSGPIPTASMETEMGWGASRELGLVIAPRGCTASLTPTSRTTLCPVQGEPTITTKWRPSHREIERKRDEVATTGRLVRPTAHDRGLSRSSRCRSERAVLQWTAPGMRAGPSH